MTYQQPRIFPEPGINNIAISLSGVGSTKNFSVLIVKDLPDIQLLYNSQTFPFYTYKPIENDDSFFDDHLNGKNIITAPSGKRYIRHENITDWAIKEYRKYYGEALTEEDIFYYVYGLLHSPDYRNCFNNDLKKMLPRIPFVASVKDFWVFSKAGREFAEFHLNYEAVEPWPLEKVIKGDPDDPATYRVTKMRFGKTPDNKEDKTAIIYNDYIAFRGIPLEAYEYVINGKSAIEWIIDRYQVHQDKKSGIVNDPNKWLEEQGNPRYIVDLIKRIVRVSIETVRIVKDLPNLDIEVSSNEVD